MRSFKLHNLFQLILHISWVIYSVDLSGRIGISDTPHNPVLKIINREDDTFKTISSKDYPSQLQIRTTPPPVQRSLRATGNLGKGPVEDPGEDPGNDEHPEEILNKGKD